MLLVAALLFAAAPDPCALRALVDKPSAVLVPMHAKAVEPRERACLAVVTANALAREGHSSDAAALYDEAGAVLVDIVPFLDIAKKRALAPPTPPPPASPAPKTAEETAARVDALLRAAKPKEAVAVGLAWKGPPLEALEVSTVTALVRAGRVDDALARCKALPDTDAFLKVRAWALAKTERAADARDAYAKLAATTQDPALKAEATFYAAFSAYEGSARTPALLDDARARFIAGADVIKGSPFEAFARWYTALSLLLESRPKEAVPVLEALVKDLPSDREVLKHRYWLGRARVDAGDVSGGKAELQAIAALEPTDYYGLLARKRLGKKPFAGRKIAPDALAKQARDDDDAKRVQLLYGVGLDDEARSLARSLGEGAPEIALQQTVDDAHFGWRRGAKFIPSPRVSGGRVVDDPRWRVSYAEPWHDDVLASAAKAGVPASFVYAIMRTESGFDPHAVSVAGARGVIQLLPSAARGACTLAKRPVSDAERIFEAPVAIDLGAALLGAERKDFGSLALAAAAYNGAASNVVSWMKLHGALEPELFVERIPFRETRDYVKRVLAVEATYRALDGDALAIDFPDKIPAPPTSPADFPMDE